MKSLASILSSFKKEYKNISGIIEITEYENCIFVFVDRSKLKTILPSSYENISISYFDLLGIKDSSAKMIDHIIKNKFDLEDEKNSRTFSYLTKTLENCDKLLNKNQIGDSK